MSGHEERAGVGGHAEDGDAGGPELVVAGSVAEASSIAAERTVAVLAAAIDERGVAHWATTGGSAAPPFYEALVAGPGRDRLDWSRVHVWWGDDRFVPADHPLSNVLPFDEIALRAGGLPIPAANVHRIPAGDAIGSGAGPELAANRYASALRDANLERDATGWPVFDLVMLGVGPDGHLLSVFPGSPAWHATDWVLPIPAPTHVEPHVERVTLNPAVVTAARTVLVVATGGGKAELLGRIWARRAPRGELPAVAAVRRGATWVLDAAASAAIAR